MVNFSYSKLNTPYPTITYQYRTKKMISGEKPNSNDGVENSNNNQTVSKISTLEYKISELENQLRSKLELYKQLADVLEDEIETSGTISSKGWVQKSTRNLTQNDIKKYTAILN